MLSRGEGLGPAAVQRDQDKHEALGVEGGPTEEEGGNNNNCKYLLSVFVAYDKRNITKHLDHSLLTLAQVPIQALFIL